LYFRAHHSGRSAIFLQAWFDISDAFTSSILAAARSCFVPPQIRPILTPRRAEFSPAYPAIASLLPALLIDEADDICSA